MRHGDETLADLIRQASPQDCLDAAFALADRSASRFVAVARRRMQPAPPFLDRDYYAAIARWLGCRFDGGAAVAEALRANAGSLVEGPSGQSVRGSDGKFLFAPSIAHLPEFAALIARRPAAAERVVITPPHGFARSACRGGPRVVDGRLRPLHGVARSALADRVTTTGQAIALGGLAGGVSCVGLVAPLATFWLAVVSITLVLMGYAASRGLAIARAPKWPPRRALRTCELPVYSVLIPLYREGDGIAQLIRALRRLDYPPDRLDIQFLVEEDDPATRDALLRHARHLPCRITVVPASMPRTKPRALNVGLRQACGSLATIFDAEDRPDPRQLRDAAETFAAAPPELAAVQARLAIDHLADNWLTRMFAIEYACQFDHILPMVSGYGGLVLLGGTSNHFRTDALVAVGGWDPFNVTEDADLAVRLRRHGYRIATIRSETHEEAPLTVSAWLKQRARWFKGYMQTWLVHNRQPLRLVRDLGWRDALLFHLFIVGALTAALAHIALLIQLGLALTGAAPVFVGGSPVLSALQVAVVLAGYGTSFVLGAVSIRARRGSRLGMRSVLWFPLYWVLMGVAVLVALHDLARWPHHWRKTSHGHAIRPTRTRFPSAGPAAEPGMRAR